MYNKDGSQKAISIFRKVQACPLTQACKEAVIAK